LTGLPAPRSRQAVAGVAPSTPLARSSAEHADLPMVVAGRYQS
jgi:hypothetical protein